MVTNLCDRAGTKRFSANLKADLNQRPRIVASNDGVQDLSYVNGLIRCDAKDRNMLMGTTTSYDLLVEGLRSSPRKLSREERDQGVRIHRIRPVD